MKLGHSYSTPWSGYYASENGIFSPLVFKYNTWLRYNATWNQDRNDFEKGYAVGYALPDMMLGFKINPDLDPSTAPELKKRVLDPLLTALGEAASKVTLPRYKGKAKKTRLSPVELNQAICDTLGMSSGSDEDALEDEPEAGLSSMESLTSTPHRMELPKTPLQASLFRVTETIRNQPPSPGGSPPPSPSLPTPQMPRS